MTTGGDTAGAPRDKLMSIQYIRAAAAIVVIVWHTGWSRTVLGQSGVDMFFVVSGFVMMLVSGRESAPGRFAAARLARIVPLYWAVTAVAAVLDRPPAGKLLTSLLFWPDGPFPVVIQGWSLNLEMSYYALFALALLAPARWRLLALTLEILFMCLVLPRVAPMSDDRVAAWSDPLAIEFLAGAWLYAGWRRGSLPGGAASWLLGAAAVAMLAGTHLLGAAPAGWSRVAFWGVPALAIVAAGLGIERAGQLPQVRVLAVLGEASYAIYLTHVLALRLVGGQLYSQWAPVAVTLALVWACVVGWAVHRLVERPAHRVTAGYLAALWPKAQARPA